MRVNHFLHMSFHIGLYNLVSEATSEVQSVSEYSLENLVQYYDAVLEIKMVTQMNC